MGLKSILACLVLLSLLASCAPGVYFSGKLRRFEPGQFLVTETRDAVSFEQMARDLAKKRVVFLGEVHISLADHRMQLRIIKSLWEGDPDLAIGLEMLPREAQPALDRYVSGELTEKEFLKQADWKKSWGYPFRLYKPVFDFARQRGIPLVALNAAERVVKKVARKGLGSLTDEERSLIAKQIDLDDPGHREWVREVFETHDEVGGFQEFYEAQCVWEETMAESVAHFLESPRGKDKRMVVLAGKGHLGFGFGIPKRVVRRKHASIAIAIPFVVSGKVQTLEKGLADYVWIRKRGRHHPGPRLGVRLKEAAEGIEVLQVMPKSRADKAGIRKGDRIIAIDGREIKSLMDAHEATAKVREKAIEIELMRKEQRINAVVEP